MTLPGWLKFLGAVLALLVAVLAVMWLFQRKLIYMPMERDVPPVERALPGAESLTFLTEDGLELEAWFLASEGPPGATVLFFNGNAGNRGGRARLARALSQRGVSVLLTDYRGYGANPGKPTETGLMADARAARSYLDGRSDVDPESIVYFGESLGAAVALGLAVERPPAALVLRSPFSSLVDVARLHYPLPIRWLLRDRYPSLERIPNLRCPLLIMAGAADNLIPPSQSRALYDAAPEGRKSFVEFEGAGHNDLEFLDGPRMMETVDRFIEQWVRGELNETPSLPEAT